MSTFAIPSTSALRRNAHEGTRRLHQSRRDTESDSEGEGRNEALNAEDASEGSFGDDDKPRAAQWQPEEDEESDASEVGNGQGLSMKLQKKSTEIGSMSFGSLLKAKRILDKGEVESDTSSDRESASEGDGQEVFSKSKSEGGRPRTVPRAHKHAPTEVTSKRPVTRRRQVVAVKQTAPRDPRFTSLTGAGDNLHFKQSYSFLSELHAEELKTLRDNFYRAQKLLHSSPRELREEREEEVERLSRAVKRAESLVSKDRRDIIESEALDKAQKEEKERRKAGKKAWHMKDSEKRDVLLRARHKFLAETGGRIAVRKAIEKKQRKTSQKEKRSRPSFVERPGSSTHSHNGDARTHKRKWNETG